jgi:DNA-binding beta-propeller fold protein YncE
VGQTPAIGNRIAFLSGATDAFVRPFNPANGTVGRAIPVPAAARLIGLRPNSEEAWTAHSGGANQVTIVNLREERVAGNILLRLNTQSIPIALHFSADGRFAWLLARNPDSAGERGTILVLDCVSRQVLSTINLGTNLPAAGALNPDGTLLLILGTSLNELGVAEPSMLAFDTLTNTFAPLTIGAANLSAVLPTELYWHPDSTRLYYLNTSNNNIEVYEFGARRVTRRLSLPRTSIVASMDVSPTGDFAIVRDNTGVASHWVDLESGEVLDSSPIPVGPGFLLPRF